MATILTDDFNSYNDGDLNGQGSWAGSTTFDVQGTTVYEGAKAIQGTANGTIKKTGTGTTPGKVALYIRSNKTNVITSFSLFEGTSEKVSFRLHSKGNIQYLDSGGNGVNVKVGYSTNTWYCLQIEWRGSGADSEVRYQVDDEGWTDWVAPLSDWTTNLNAILFEIWNAVSGYAGLWDYIIEAPIAPAIKKSFGYIIG